MEFKLSLFLALFLLAEVGVDAATNTAASASRADVNTALAACSDGDTLVIPAGKANWTSQLTINKAITVLGSGTNLSTGTVITNGIGGSSQVFVLNTSSTNSLIRMSNFTIECNRNGGAIYVGTQPMRQFRIDRMNIRNSSARAIFVVGWIFGVIDNNWFENCQICFSPERSLGLSVEQATWAASMPFGTTNMVVFETNYIEYNNNWGGGGADEAVYHQDASLSTTRFNTVHSSWSSDVIYFLECHGDQTGDLLSTRGGEVYGNVLHADKLARPLYFRGGHWMVYSNQFTRTNGNNYAFSITEEEGWQTAWFSPLISTWPATNSVKLHAWENYGGGSLILPTWASTGHPGYDDILLPYSTNYWTNAPQSGDLFYPYTALTYPHPLVTALDGEGGGGSSSGSGKSKPGQGRGRRR